MLTHSERRKVPERDLCVVPYIQKEGVTWIGLCAVGTAAALAPRAIHDALPLLQRARDVEGRTDMPFCSGHFRF